MKRKTKATEAIFGYLRDSEEALSAVRLVQAFQDTCDKVTVYRVLERLEKSGKIHRIMGVEGNTYFATCGNCTEKNHHDYHAHLQCKNCGTVVCLNAEVQLPAKGNFKVESEHLLLYGECEACVGG